MARKIIGATCLALVLICALANPTRAIESETALLVWWPLDEGEGTVAVDHSGNEYDGTFVGEPQWVAGYTGFALSFDGVDDYAVYEWDPAESFEAFTVAFWVRADTLGQPQYCSPFTGHYPNTAGFQIDVDGGNPGNYRVNPGGLIYGPASTDWVHLVLVSKGTSAQVYYDGALAEAGSLNDSMFNEFAIGVNRNRNWWFNGAVDELRVYNRTISAAQVEDLFNGIAPTFFKAEEPSPADGAIDVTNPLFTWVAGEDAVFHDVYLGTDPDLGPEDLVAPHWPTTLYWHAPGLEPGTVYYWRVDEIATDGTVYTGDVWTFAVTPLEAWQPDPADGSPYIDPNATLTWAKGLNGVSHDVYFSADETAVVEGTPDAFKGNQFGTSYVTGDLDMDATYYWRIDEIDAAGNKMAGHIWSFTTLPEIPITDPNLRTYWKLDAGAGSRAVDWSGHGSHGQFEGDPLWVPGYDGYALEFDGDDDSVIYMFEAAGEWPAFAVSLWARAAYVGQSNWSSVYSGHTPNTAGFQIDVDGTDPGNWRVNPSGLIFGGVTTDWVHLVLTATGTSAKLYYNGVWVTSGTLNDSTFNSVAIARNRNIDSRWAGMIDDVRVFDRELDQEEIELVLRIDPLRAWQPHPADAAIADVRTATPLAWTRGDNASQHDVYLGADAAAVAAADTTDATGIYRGRQGATSHTPTEGIEWGQQYFWRVDEVNSDGSITTGRVWAFTVADYLIIDDFESYTNESPNRVFQAWIDGIGFSPDEHYPDGDPGNGTTALVGYDVWSVDSPHYNGTIMETDDVYSGRLAMPVEYDNALTPWYAEATRTWATPQNWLFNDVNTLVVHFKGAPVDLLQTGPDSLVMSAAGTDIWDVADEFRYVYKQLNGDGEIIARVDSIVDTHASAKAGVMIRESLDPGSRHAMVVVTPSAGVKFERRLTTNDVSIGTTETGIVAPHWVKLTRTGNELTAQHSADGVTWVDVGPDPAASTDTVVMGGAVYIGLALTSHSAGVATTAEYAAIQTSGGVSGQWQMAEIGVDHPGNSANTLYVAVEDTGGSVAIVTHPDGTDAVLSGQWQRWAVDLGEFVGVNLLSVKKMSIGIGDRTNPQADGAGQMLFDDFRITQGVPVDPNAVE